jgi:hypothetical protein
MKIFIAQKCVVRYIFVSLCLVFIGGGSAQVANLPLEIRSDNPEVVITGHRQAQKNPNNPSMIVIVFD